VHDDEIVRETKAVNGGTIGLAHRQKVTAAAREALA
jgi:predicted chitinase